MFFLIYIYVYIYIEQNRVSYSLGRNIYSKPQSSLPPFQGIWYEPPHGDVDQQESDGPCSLFLRPNIKIEEPGTESAAHPRICSLGIHPILNL
jgi:hypothetical protein